MSEILINGGKTLKGEVEISGSKNAALPIMAAAMLTEDKTELLGIPALADVQNMRELISCFGAKCEVSPDGTITVRADRLHSFESSYELVSKLRASFLVAGPMLARCGKIKIPLPGGCRIGTRPVDLHLKGLASLGAEVNQGHGFIEMKCKKLTGSKIYLDFPSVGATENLMMAAVLASGQTIIANTAVEPEIVDLANFLNSMGAKIVGAGTDSIRIEGVSTLKGVKHTVIPDRIEAGTYIAAAAITHGKIKISNVICDHLKPVTAKMREANAQVTEDDNSITIDAQNTISAVDIKTMPYPGFPTDMQAPYSALMSVADGTSMIIETVFENRFLHIPELKRMGAQIKIEGRTAIIEGSKSLSGAKVQATDLRAGAALVLAALSANGQTEIASAEHIDRGYSDIEKKLSALGADIKRK